MPDTPKSFEEWWSVQDTSILSTPAQYKIAKYWASLAYASLTPQTAPGSDDFDEAGIRAARPDVSEGGEGELTVVTGSTAEDVNIDFYYAGAVDEHIRRLKTERDLAIAQRDEAREALPGQRLYAKDVLAAEQRAEAAEAKLSAGCKPEELERLEKWLRAEAAERSSRASSRRQYAQAHEHCTNEDRKAAHAIAEGMAGRSLPKTSKAQDDESARVQERIAAKLEQEAEMLTRWADGLRSLPSEPQDENRKAAENVR